MNAFKHLIIVTFLMITSFSFAQTQVVPSFSYQGYLEKAGQPVTGQYDFRFELYDVLSGGSPVTLFAIDHNVQVTNGVFTATVDFGNGIFTGDTLYIEIMFKPTNDPGAVYTELSPRQKLLAVPYAISLVPGAVVLSDYGTALSLESGSESGSALFVNAPSTLGNMAAIYATSAGETGAGLSGFGGSSTGTNYGVIGGTYSPNGYGVYGSGPITGVMGEAKASSGFTEGVKGKTISASDGAAGVAGYSEGTTGASAGVLGMTNSINGYGVRGHNSALGSTTPGVYGTASSLAGRGVQGDGMHYGVYGLGTDEGGLSIGVYGKTESLANYSAGVSGYAPSIWGELYGVLGVTNSYDGRGVFGEALSLSGPSCGVYGKTASDTGYGVYSEGRAHIDGKLSWKPKTSFISISASAFNPESETDQYLYTNQYLRNEDSHSVYFFAPVQLPHKSTITSMKFVFNDISVDNNGTVTLYRASLSGQKALIATVSSSGTPGDSSSSTTPAGDSYVDNEYYIYYLEMTLPDSLVDCAGVIIGYTFTEPY